MTDLASALAMEIFEFCKSDFLGMSTEARTFYVSGYGYGISPKENYAIVRTPSSRGRGLKFPHGLQLREFDELVGMGLCSPGCKVLAVTTLEGPRKRWIPFKEGVIQIDNCRSMTVFKRDGSVERITIDVPTWGGSA